MQPHRWRISIWKGRRLQAQGWVISIWKVEAGVPSLWGCPSPALDPVTWWGKQLSVRKLFMLWRLTQKEF